MVYAIVESEAALTGSKIITFEKYNDFSEMIRDTFPPDSMTIWIMDTKAAPHGRTYKQKKRTLLYKAFNLQYIIMSIDNKKALAGGDDLSMIKEYFYKYGKKYGLLKQFKSNNII